jgi:hypothetical protein
LMCCLPLLTLLWNIWNALKKRETELQLVYPPAPFLAFNHLQYFVNLIWSIYHFFFCKNVFQPISDIPFLQILQMCLWNLRIF